MREFFHGWRRKAGCVTLMMACAVMGLWIRGQRFRDELAFASASGTEKEIHAIVSAAAGIMWIRERLPDWSMVQVTSFPVWNSHRYGDDDTSDFSGETDTRGDSLWRWKWCGFDLGQGNHYGKDLTGPTISYWIAPYWSIAIPLMLLSAYLILWKPRKQTGADHA